MPDFFCNSASNLVDFLQLGSLSSKRRGSETGSGTENRRSEQQVRQ